MNNTSYLDLAISKKKKALIKTIKKGYKNPRWVDGGDLNYLHKSTYKYALILVDYLFRLPCINNIFDDENIYAYVESSKVIISFRNKYGYGAMFNLNHSDYLKYTLIFENLSNSNSLLLIHNNFNICFGNQLNNFFIKNV